MIWIYNILITLLAPIWVPLVWHRSKRRNESPNWQERFGNFKIELDRKRPVVWVHTVSVGEVIAAAPMLKELKSLWPEVQVVLSVTTSSGHQIARERKDAGELFDHLVYFPIDVVRFMAAAMLKVKPCAVAIVETELWFNFLTMAKNFRATTLLVNARISDRSYGRSRWVKFFYESVFDQVDRVLAQTPIDAERLAFLGAKNVEVAGNTKFDEPEKNDQDARQKVRAKFGITDEELLVVVGSTRSELEEHCVVDALAGCGIENLKVVHAPRHLETVERLDSTVRTKFDSVGKWSQRQAAKYLILDTYGELADAYAGADLAIVGGGFDNLGGQNIIQPLAAGIPTLHGKYMQNFRSAADQAIKQGASRRCDGELELRAAITELLSNPEMRSQMSTAGKELVAQNRGASKRIAEAIIQEGKAAFKPS